MLTIELAEGLMPDQETCRIKLHAINSANGPVKADSH